MNITIPPAALEAGARAVCAGNKWGEPCATPCSDCLPEVRAAFLAIVKAWPGASAELSDTGKPHLILPLPPQENSDGLR